MWEGLYLQFELFFLGLSLLFVSCFLFLPPGLIIAKRLLNDQALPLTPQHEIDWESKIRVFPLLLAPGIGLMFIAALAVICELCGVPNSVLGYAAVAISACCLYFLKPTTWFSQRVSSSHSLRFLTVWLLFYFLVLALSSFPEGNWRDIDADTVMSLTNLPRDLQIPYNSSRYFLEDIPFAKYPVVPQWSVSDRPPLAALAFVVLASSLGLKDHSIWTETTPTSYFPFHCLLAALNLLSLGAVWYLAWFFYGYRTACYSALILLCSNFYLTNAIFSWPKLLMTYYLLLALFLGLQRSRKSIFLSGLFSAGALLSHEAALFTLPFVMFILAWPHKNLRQCNFRQNFRDIWVNLLPKLAIFSLPLLIFYFPWMVFKFYFPASSNMVQLHLFCNSGPVAMPFFPSLKNYIHAHSLGEIASIRLSNLLYPFDPRPLYFTIRDFAINPLAWIQSLYAITFFRSFYALGAPFALFIIYSVCRCVWFYPNRQFLLIWAAAWATLLPYSLIAGCPDYSVAHVWGYAAILLSAIAVAKVLKEGSPLISLLCGLSLGLGLSQSFFYLFLHPSINPWQHSSLGYQLTALAIVLLLMTLLVFIGKEHEDS